MIDEKKLIEALCKLGEETEKHKKTAEKDPQQGMFEFALSNQLAMPHNAIEKVKEQPKIGEWIPCSERLPETQNNILVCQRSGYVSIGYYRQGNFLDLNSYLFDGVIAWQPLPEPYKG